jgi:hypothetical protein
VRCECCDDGGDARNYDCTVPSLAWRSPSVSISSKRRAIHASSSPSVRSRCCAQAIPAHFRPQYAQRFGRTPFFTAAAFR